MIDTLPTMASPKPKNFDKEWTVDEVRTLADLAKRKGISYKKLAEDWFGVHPTTVSYWMSEKARKDPPKWALRLMSAQELQITKLPDDE